MTTKRFLTVTIPSGDTISGAVNLGDIETPCAVKLPAAFTGASIGILAAAERGATPTALRGTDVTSTTKLAIAPSASEWVPLPFLSCAGFADIYFTSPSSEGATRTFVVAARQNGIG